MKRSNLTIVCTLMMTLAACQISRPAPTTTPTPIPPVTLQPTITPLPEATFTPSPSPTSSGWRGILQARKPTLDEIHQNSLWMALGIDAKDMRAPGLETYSGLIHKDQEYLFPIYWCAKDALTFHANMQLIETELVVNGEIVPDEYILTYNYTDQETTWSCNYRSVVLSGWQPGVEYVLEMKRTLTQEISDGEASYAPGLYIYQLTVTAQ